MVPNSVYTTLGPEVHKQMFHSVKFPSKLGSHLSTHCNDERLSRPFPIQGLNLGPVAWKRDALLSHLLGFREEDAEKNVSVMLDGEENEISFMDPPTMPDTPVRYDYIVDLLHQI
ncbi:hypothetical protein TNCV_4049871 [Trichonephila clavipes]|nr:hypothetical protein TNCV_4049871 [Trichonephila clavipes]